MMKNKWFGYCRIVAAVAVLALVVLVLKLPQLVKLFTMLFLAFLAGFDFKDKKEKAPKLYNLLCISLTLALGIFLSYVLPSRQDMDLTPMTIVSCVVIAPICEEAFFRGALSKLPIPIITSSIIFGLFHGTGFIQATLMGVIFMYFYRSSKRLITSIICHFANNLLAVICLWKDIRLPTLIASLFIAVMINIIGVKNEKKIL